MALSGTVVWEIRTTGSDNNGGGYNSAAGGTDFSQQAAAQATLTAASVVHTTTTQINVSAGDYTVVAGDVGNLVNITGGSATPGVYEITVADTINNRWTVDRSVGTAGQTCVGAMGGAFASLGRAGQFSVSNNKIYIQAGTYSITTATANVSNGVFNNTTFWRGIEGYQTVRGDLGTPPLLQSNGVIGTFIMITLTTGNHSLINVDIDCNGSANSSGVSITGGYVYKCKVSNFTVSGFVVSTDASAIRCEATGGSGTAGFNLNSTGSIVHSCYAHDNTCPGFLLANRCSVVNCIADTNTGAATDGFLATTFTAMYINCVAYNNGRDGFRTPNQIQQYINCIAESNTGVGFNNPSNQDCFNLWNCAYYNNGTNVSLGTGLYCYNINGVLGTGSFFTNAAAGDFSLNNTAGAGAAARSAGYPGLFPGGLSQGYLDIGAIQHQATGGGGGETSHVF